MFQLSGEFERRKKALQSGAELQLSRTEEVMLGAFQDGIHLAAIPENLGGRLIAQDEIQERFIDLATEDLSAALLITQRHSALSWLAKAERTPFTEELLSKGCQSFLVTQTVSTITPAARAPRSSVKVNKISDGIELNGFSPWASGASMADYLIVGGHDENGEGIVCCIPTDSIGLSLDSLGALHALDDSDSVSVRFDKVVVPATGLLFGPSASLFRTGKGVATRIYPALHTSALALGHAQKALNDLMGLELSTSIDDTIQSLVSSQKRLKGELMELSLSSRPVAERELKHREIRARANVQAVRASEALFSVSGGADFSIDGDISRHCRESHFFLVWSCTTEIRRRTLDLLNAKG